MQRFSQQRERIYEAVRTSMEHPTAQMVYDVLRPEMPRLSLGTVYRNLIFFQERGDIRSVGVVRGHERFDGITTPHSHFICSRCGAVMDLSQIELADHLDRDVSEQYGLMVDYHELSFHGVCQTCIQNQQHEEDILS